MKILTANIRYSGAPDGPDAWDNRKDVCVRVIREQEADLIAFQEMARDQLACFLEALPGYGSISTLDEPVSGQPCNTIFYRSRDLWPVSQGAYWLSRTPHIPGSRSWESDCIRLAVWVHLRRSDGFAFRLVNTHLDHISQTARVGQAAMISEDAAVWPPEFPQILTGDLNADAANPAITGLFDAGWQDTYETIHGVRDPGRTYHAFQGADCPDPLGKIDWIFTRGAIRPTDAQVIRTRVGERYPSDHYFVSAVIRPV